MRNAGWHNVHYVCDLAFEIKSGNNDVAQLRFLVDAIPFIAEAPFHVFGVDDRISVSMVTQERMSVTPAFSNFWQSRVRPPILDLVLQVSERNQSITNRIRKTVFPLLAIRLEEPRIFSEWLHGGIQPHREVWRRAIPQSLPLTVISLPANACNQTTGSEGVARQQLPKVALRSNHC